mmetsp:Transcript_14434/g.21648  ORF Transcript_14434/g.21648 Transcript_14434/m.21648 type:complete len:303 (+) Transcript_14434:378-1286(+)
MLLLLMIPGFSPSRHSLPMKHNHMEKRIKEQNRIGLHRNRIQESRLRRSIKRVRKKSRLNHDQTIGRILTIQNVAIVRCFIRTGIEELQKLRSTEVEHELWKETELGRQSERSRVFRYVICKLVAKSNQTSIQPAHDIRNIFLFCTINGKTCREHSSSLLIKTIFDGCNIRSRRHWLPILLQLLTRRTSCICIGIHVMPRPTKRGTPKPRLSTRMLILGQELNVPPLPLWKNCISRNCYFKINRHGSIRINPAHSPRISPTLSNHDFTHISPIFIKGSDGSNGPLHLTFSRSDDFHGCPKGH